MKERKGSHCWMFAAGEEETIFLADTRDGDNKIVTRLLPSFFFPPFHPPLILLPLSFHLDRVILASLRPSSSPSTRRRIRGATVDERDSLFRRRDPSRKPLMEEVLFPPGPNSGRLHCRIIATPLNRNPSAEKEVIVPRTPPTNQPAITFFLLLPLSSLLA